MMFGRKTEEPEAMNMVGRAIEAGVNFIDTADMYSAGESEEILGKALKRSGKRDAVVLATKVHGRMRKDDVNSGGVHRRHVIEGCEASLRRLATDYIDLYQMHRCSPEVPIDESLRAMDDLVRAGKIRYVGSSTFPAWRIVESLWASKELGLNRIVCEQPPYNLLDRRIERELVPMARSYGLALIPWSPLAGGFLTGKYKRQDPGAAEGRLGGGGKWMADHFTEAAFALLDVLAQMAAEKSCTPSQLALAWCAAQAGITCPIIGPRTMEQLEDNLGAANVAVTGEDCARLDAVAPPGQALVRYYESGTWAATEHRWA
jgi:aryl-alcohol dehydrogenase-like predicted oxidoreductase